MINGNGEKMNRGNGTLRYEGKEAVPFFVQAVAGDAVCPQAGFSSCPDVLRQVIDVERMLRVYAGGMDEVAIDIGVGLGHPQPIGKENFIEAVINVDAVSGCLSSGLVPMDVAKVAEQEDTTVFS